MLRVFSAGVLALFVLFGVFIGILLWSHPARSHDHWIRAFKGPDGQSCCGIDDCAPVPGSMVSVTPGGYYLKETGETIPMSQALPSQDGQFWRCRYLVGINTGKTRCFFKTEPGM